MSACVIVVSACTAPPPSPTPSPRQTLLPPQLPTVRNATPFFTASNGSWTFRAFIDPNGSPTDIVLEYGVGKSDPPKFGSTVPVASGSLTASDVKASVTLPIELGFCVRFTATSAAGATYGEAYCQEALVLPAPSG